MNDDERLDDAVEALMADRPLPTDLTPPVAELLTIAADLRDLPTAAFKARLKAELRVAAAPSYGPPLATAADIAARLAELAGPPRFVAHNLDGAFRELPALTMRFLAPLDAWTVVATGWSDAPNWERHPAADELLHVLEGGLDVTTLTASGPVHATVPAGSLFVCRKGLWHRGRPRGRTSVVSLTPGEGTAHFQGDDPRHAIGAAVDVPLDTPPTAGSAADVWNLSGAVAGLATLAITPDTTQQEADGAVRELGWLHDRLVGVMRFAGDTPWERHPDGDELLHVLDGVVDVTVLTDDGPRQVPIGTGEVFVCPRGLWHRQRSKTAATILFATPTATSEASSAEDPRSERSE